MTQELIERLRRTETRTSHVATNRTAPIIESKYQALINPDGPEAASELQSQSAHIAELEGVIDAIANGRINTDFVMSDPPNWHKAFSDLQSLAKAVSLTKDSTSG